MGTKHEQRRNVGQEEPKIAPGKPLTDPEDTPYDPENPFDPFDTNEPDPPSKPKVQPGYNLPDDEEEEGIDPNTESRL